jgi:lipopolysaccharide transport system ATP-binding protein
MRISFGGESHELPRGAVIGVIGDNESGLSPFLQAAGGRFLGPGHPLDLSPAPLIVLGYLLDLRDAYARAEAFVRFEELRREGSTVLLASHDPQLLRAVSDEVWWIDDDRVVEKGDPDVVLSSYARHTAERLRSLPAPAIQPALRRGDGRAELVSIDAPATVTSGEEMSVTVTVRYAAAVQDPVVGIMIRTRIGMEVYGTNTELERVVVGPCSAGDLRIVTFRFACNLCPQSYTLTAASHDPDGVWHDWMEDAVAFTVADTRYTAGVANLRARVEVSGSRE